MIITLPEEVKRAKEIIDAQYVAGHLTSDNYVLLHNACDTIYKAFGNDPEPQSTEWSTPNVYAD